MKGTRAAWPVTNPLLFFSMVVLMGVGAAAPLEDQCSPDVQKVTTCLSFAKGTAATPSKECCGAVADIKGSRPQCLCYIIKLTHSGNEQVKSLGLQEAKLLQLPSACKLTNASVSDCPRLLDIPVGSPDYAIFNGSSMTTTAPATGSATGSSSPATADGSVGSRRRPNFVGAVAMAAAIFFCALPTGLVPLMYTRG